MHKTINSAIAFLAPQSTKGVGLKDETSAEEHNMNIENDELKAGDQSNTI